jgi:hypothetical protein
MQEARSVWLGFGSPISNLQSPISNLQSPISNHQGLPHGKTLTPPLALQSDASERGSYEKNLS